MILAALDAGAERIVVGCGDSGTCDAGAGAAQALGVRLLDAGGRDLGPSTIALGFAMDVNRVIMSLTDKGEIGAAFSSVSGGGAWRAITDQYIFSSGVNIGATVELPGGGLDTLVFIGGPFSEVRPGRLTPFETRSGATLPGSDQIGRAHV